MKLTITEEVSAFNQEEASPMWTHKLYKSILIVSCGTYLVMFILDASAKAGFRPKLQIFEP